MNKKQLSERDICTKYITPALEQAGWDVKSYVLGMLFYNEQERKAGSPDFYYATLSDEEAEFDREKAWWGEAERKGRKTTEQAWKVSAKELAERNYNLDCKNPHEVEVNHRDPEELMAEYQQIVHQLEAAQQALKAELMAYLGRKA